MKEMKVASRLAIVTAFAPLALCNYFAVNEYTTEVCSYANESITLSTESQHPNYTIRYLIFHYEDMEKLQLPPFRKHTFEDPKQCSIENDSDGCKNKWDGYFFDYNNEISYANGIFNPGAPEDEKSGITKNSRSFKVNAPGFYCAYINTDTDFYGNITFQNSFGALDIDNYTRLGLQLPFIPLHMILLLVALVWKYPKDFQKLVVSVTVIRMLDIMDLTLVAKTGLNALTELFHVFIKNIAANVLIALIIQKILRYSVGYGIVEDESMISEHTFAFTHLLLPCLFAGVKIFNEMYFNNSLLPFYDLHFNSIRRFLLLLKYLPYLFVYVSVVFEFLSLKKAFGPIKDLRVTKSFSLFIVVPPLIGAICTLLSIYIQHNSTPSFYDTYFVNKYVILLNVLPEFSVVVSLAILAYIWKPPRRQKYEPVAELEDVELGSMQR